MSKLKLLLLVSLALTAACGGQAPAATPPAKTDVPATIPPAPTTAAAVPTQPGGGFSLTPASPAAAPKLDPAGMCKAASAPQPVPNFPAALPADQVRGQANAPATLYEYSDFQ
jgi:hypothetical protein